MAGLYEHTGERRAARRVLLELHALAPGAQDLAGLVDLPRLDEEPRQAQPLLVLRRPLERGELGLAAGKVEAAVEHLRQAASRAPDDLVLKGLLEGADVGAPLGTIFDALQTADLSLDARQLESFRAATPE